jgi:phage FluMu protein Com
VFHGLHGKKLIGGIKMKATICDKCKEITTKPETVRFGIGKQKIKAELCETCTRKLLGFFDGGTIHADAPKPKPIKADAPAVKSQLAPEKPKQPIKSLRDIGLALAPSAPTAVKGFLYLKCPNCGEVRGFCAKQETSQYICNACHTTSEIGNLVPLRFRCECGASFGYQTNMTDEMFDIKCIDCGNPVAVIFNSNIGAYENVRTRYAK